MLRHRHNAKDLGSMQTDHPVRRLDSTHPVLILTEDLRFTISAEVSHWFFVYVSRKVKK